MTERERERESKLTCWIGEFIADKQRKKHQKFVDNEKTSEVVLIGI
jgi:hypothetical protein